MTDKKSKHDLPLAQKLLLFLVIICALSLIGSYRLFMNCLNDTTHLAVSSMSVESVVEAREVCDFLEASDGDVDMVDSFVKDQGIYCTVRLESGETIYDRDIQREAECVLSATSIASTTLDDGTVLYVRTWSDPVDNIILEDTMKTRILAIITVQNILVFLLIAAGLYYLVLRPLIDLRRSMAGFRDFGTEPVRSRRKDELGRLQNTFADLVSALNGKEKSQHRLIASIAHDIRTPLTSVLGYSERLASNQLPPEKQQQYIEIIHRKADSIKSVVDEFDDYIQMGTAENIPLVIMKAESLCETLKQEFGAELADSGVDFSVECLCRNEDIRCNYDRLRRYFGNLIGNSLAHSGAEHPILHVSCERREKAILLTFSDNGNGVAPEYLERIFEPFYTSDEGRKVSGMGLAICRSIIKAHGGSVHAENLPQGGLAVIASLPVM